MIMEYVKVSKIVKTPTQPQPNLTKVWVLHENDFTPPPPTTTTTTKLNVTNISAVTESILTKL